jgi:hypothetical protein
MSANLDTLIEIKRQTKLFVEAVQTFTKVVPEFMTSKEACGFLRCSRSKLAMIAKKNDIKRDDGKYIRDKLLPFYIDENNA